MVQMLPYANFDPFETWTHHEPGSKRMMFGGAQDKDGWTDSHLDPGASRGRFVCSFWTAVISSRYAGEAMLHRSSESGLSPSDLFAFGHFMKFWCLMMFQKKCSGGAELAGCLRCGSFFVPKFGVMNLNRSKYYWHILAWIKTTANYTELVSISASTVNKLLTMALFQHGGYLMPRAMVSSSCSHGSPKILLFHAISGYSLFSDTPR